MQDKQDFYHILHVHPEADRAVIKASYQTLMQKLKYHPDLGGDTRNAALINEAYRVLFDVEARARYDKSLSILRHQEKQAEKPKCNPWEKTDIKPIRRFANYAQHTYSSILQRVNQDDIGKRKCPFCNESNHYNKLVENQKLMICHNCKSPLQFIHFDSSCLTERVINRIDKSTSIQFILQKPPGKLHLATVEDLSPTGMRFNSTQALKMGNIIKIENEELAAVASVVRCEKLNGTESYSSGVKFLTLKLKKARGNFVSHRA